MAKAIWARLRVTLCPPLERSHVMHHPPKDGAPAASGHAAYLKSSFIFASAFIAFRTSCGKSKASLACCIVPNVPRRCSPTSTVRVVVFMFRRHVADLGLLQKTNCRRAACAGTNGRRHTPGGFACLVCFASSRARGARPARPSFFGWASGRPRSPGCDRDGFCRLTHVGQPVRGEL